MIQTTNNDGRTIHVESVKTEEQIKRDAEHKAFWEDFKVRQNGIMKLLSGLNQNHVNIMLENIADRVKYESLVP